MLVSFAKRIVQMILTLILASTVIFVLIHLSGDPTQGFLPAGASPEVRAATRARLGLDQPIVEQYARFLKNGLLFDFGDSWRDRQPALNAVLDRLPATLTLAGSALAIAIAGGLVIGVLSAASGSNIALNAIRIIPLAGQAVPTFWLGAMLMLVFAVRLGWLPSSGNATPSALVLPALTLAAHPGSIIARLVSTGMRELDRSDFVRTARGKGLPNWRISVRHVLPNALLPVLAYVGLQAGFLVGGAVVIESVFAWPGVGRLALQSAVQHDLPVIHAFVVVTAIGVILINLVVDLVRILIDPRQRLQTDQGVLAHG
ncbi:MAG TPA: ABC transporter permease [Thermomicrobiales bacterium]|nr:ABC transporter permease [Thermomicrobiales bacterium]